MGAYAAGTIATTLTRRYHGLLIAPVYPPLGRVLVCAKADATLQLNGHEFPLYCNRWRGGNIEPKAYLHLESFQLLGRVPVWHYAFGEYLLEMRIWMEPNQPTTYVAYRLHYPSYLPDPGAQVSVKLLMNQRDHHATTAARAFSAQISSSGQQLIAQPAGPFTLSIQAQNGEFETDSYWIENFDLPLERDRGLSDSDNHLQIGTAALPLQAGHWNGLAISLAADASPTLDAALARYQDHEKKLLDQARGQLSHKHQPPAWIDQLTLAADSFLIQRPIDDKLNGSSVIAGYPWFGDWGRDTMIALPGLTLATGQAARARSILLTFANFVDQGMLPNVFPGAGHTPEYNSVDAALWYIEAWRAYCDHTHDWNSLAEVYPTLSEIILAYRDGTRYNIAMDTQDGLIYAGQPGVQLTWMDAKVGDWVVTPRHGKAVEINALWYHGLCCMQLFAQQLHKDTQTWQQLASLAKRGFQRFLRPTAGLYDVIDSPAGTIEQIRPNQIFAVSLLHSALSSAAQVSVVQQCAHELLTSYGLRSLAASDPDYQPVYQGDVWQRDGSYHQGCVWTWLLGHYAIAEYRVTGNAPAALARLQPIADHLHDAGLGTVSEIFDAATPHNAVGAPSQAWSVACVLQAYAELIKKSP